MTGRVMAKDIARIALMSASLVAVQTALMFIPGVELVSVLIMAYTLHFGWRALYAVYVYVMLEGLLFGFGVWWIAYLYIWTVLYLITRLTANNSHFLFRAFINGAFGLCFGALASIPYFFISGVTGGVSYFLAGIPFDIMHCAGNFLTALILCSPLTRLMKRIDP